MVCWSPPGLRVDLSHYPKNAVEAQQLVFWVDLLMRMSDLDFGVTEGYFELGCPSSVLRICDRSIRGTGRAILFACRSHPIRKCPHC